MALLGVELRVGRSVTNATQKQKIEPECKKNIDFETRKNRERDAGKPKGGGHLNFKKRFFVKQIYKDKHSFLETLFQGA